VRDFAIDVLSEASRRETAVRGVSSDVVQYTSAYFISAKQYVLELGHVPRRRKGYAVLRVLIPIAFTAAGIVLPAGLADGGWPGLSIIGGALLGAAALGSYVIEDKNGKSAE
jgi:hypothetical protein